MFNKLYIVIILMCNLINKFNINNNIIHVLILNKYSITYKTFYKNLIFLIQLIYLLFTFKLIKILNIIIKINIYSYI